MAWKRKTQTITASSSTKAEFTAAFTTAKAVRHLRFILQELGFSQEELTETHIDDQAALQIINNDQALTVPTRHPDVKFFSLQDWQEEGSISMVHIAGVLNPSDDLTKPLACCLHTRHCRRMMGHFN